MKVSVRKLISSILALAMVLVLCPVMSMATEGSAGSVHWTLDEASGLLTISGTGPMEVAMLEGDVSPFQSNVFVKRVVIESGITTIMKNAFRNDMNLTEVQIPDTVTAIGDNAFDGDTPLAAVKLPANLKTIGENAFHGCELLKEVSVPEGVTSIGAWAFSYCEALESVTLPNTLTTIGENAFNEDDALTSIAIPDSVTSIGAGAFAHCRQLAEVNIPKDVTVLPEDVFNTCAFTSMVVPDGVTTIETGAFGFTALTEIYIPASVTEIQDSAFTNTYYLTDIYYGGTEAQWAQWGLNAGYRREVAIHCNYKAPAEPEPTPTPTPAPAPDADYLYNTEDPGRDVVLPVDMLDKIATEDDAAVAVQTLTSSMTDAQKQSATGIDLATLFAERAAALAAMVSSATGDPIQITAAQLSQVQTSMDGAAAKVASALTNGGVPAVREMAKTVVFDAGFANSVVVRIDPDVLDATADKVRVETDKFAITFALEDMAADLKNGVLEFKVEVVTGASGAAALTPKASGTSRNLTLQVTMPSGGITAPVTLSLKAGASAADYETLKLNGSATPSKYNPVTRTMDGKTMASGTYTTETNEVDFTDIQDKSAEMQAAIKSLASRGVLAGTSATEFSPDETMTRGQIAILLSRVLGVYDDRIVSTFTDVSKGSWYYVGAASCQKADLMSGSGDGKFNGDKVFSKVEIAAASSNVLTRFMGYKIPANPEQYLSRYSDTISSWATGAVALNTRENILLYRTDGKFAEGSEMTRGDVAIVIERLFSRIW